AAQFVATNLAVGDRRRQSGRRAQPCREFTLDECSCFVLSYAHRGASEGRAGMFAEMRRLHERGPGCRGLVVDTDGVMLGPDCVLVRRTARGFEAADSQQLAALTKSVFAEDARLRRLPQVLAGVVTALEAGDLVKAQLLGLALRLVKLDDAQLHRLSRPVDLAKDEASFDPNQPRDKRGRWTTEGGQAVSGAAAARMTMPPP